MEMFSSIVGFYVHFRDETVPDTVQAWNVKQLALDRNVRHSDAQVLMPDLMYVCNAHDAAFAACNAA